MGESTQKLPIIRTEPEEGANIGVTPGVGHSRTASISYQGPAPTLARLSDVRETRPQSVIAYIC